MRPRLIAILRRYLAQIPPRYWAANPCPAAQTVQCERFNRGGLTYEVIRLRDSHDLMPLYKGEKGWSALRDFFGLSMKETRFVFDRGEYYGPAHALSPSRVISHLDSVIESYETAEN